jgi:hypothetical protein
MNEFSAGARELMLENVWAEFSTFSDRFDPPKSAEKYTDDHIFKEKLGPTYVLIAGVCASVSLQLPLLHGHSFPLRQLLINSPVRDVEEFWGKCLEV